MEIIRLLANSFRCGSVFLVLLFFSISAQATTYDFSYSGRLVDDTGKPFDGPLALKVSFFHSPTSTSPVLEITAGLSNVSLQDGVFQITMALDPQDFNTVFPAVVQAVYLQITDVTHGKSYDRQQISMLPYAGKIPVDESKFYWNTRGELSLVDQSINLAAPGAIGVTTPSTAQFTSLGATAPSAASTALTVKGAASQSGNLTEWKNSSGTVLTAVDPAGTLKFSGGTSNTIGLKAPSSLSTNLTYTLPVAPTAGAYLTTDNSGNMSWVTSSSSVDATGLTGLTQGSVPFAKSSGLGEDNAAFVWDDANKRLGIGTSTPGTSLDVNGNLRISNLRSYALTRALSTAADDTILLGTLEFASKSAAVTLKVAMSGFGAAKSYFLPLSYDQTLGTWKEVMPLTASKEGIDNFAVDVNVNATTAIFRLRRVAGTTAGTAYVTLIHEGVMTDTFTSSSTTGNSAAPGSYYSSSLLTMTGGSIIAGGPINLPADPTTAMQAATKQYVDASVASNATGTSTTTFTNKTIDAASNTISNISNTNLSATAAIEDSKLATISAAGKVSGAAITSGTIAGSTAVSTSGSIATTGKAGVGAAAGTSQLEVKGSGATSATSALNVMNSTPTSLLFVRDDGNVGIGTTNPGATLELSGSNTPRLLFNATNTNRGYISLNSTTFDFASSVSPGAFRFLGTADPSFPVVNINTGLGGNSSVLTLNNYLGTNKNLVVKAHASQTANITEWQNSGGTAMSVVDSTGRFGIGTTSPGSLLQVAGDITPEVDSTRSVGSAALRYGTVYTRGVNSGVNTLSVSGGAMLFNVAGTDRVRIVEGLRVGNAYVNIAAPTDGAIISGNVGIGTPSPGSKLDIIGQSGASIPGLRVMETGATPTMAGNADNLLTVRGTGSSATAWRGRITAGGDNAAFLFGEYNSKAWIGAHNAALNAWADVYLNPDGAATAYIGAFPTAATPVMTIKNSNGNVGIGTTIPSNLLSVSPTQYSTGTASQSGATVTGSGTTFTFAMVGSQLVFANGTSAGTITAVTNGTTLTVSTSQTVTSQAYLIQYYGLHVSSTGKVSVGSSSPTSTSHLTVVPAPNSGSAIDIPVTLTSGTGIDLTSGNGISGTATGINFGSWGVRSGKAININAMGMTSGTAIDIGGVGVGGTTTSSGHIIHVHPSKSPGWMTSSESGNYLKLARDYASTGGGTLNLTGDIAAFSSNCTQSGGTCNDSSSILSLTQSYANASGTVLKVDNSGTGYAATFTGGNVGIGTTSPAQRLSVGASGDGSVAIANSWTTYSDERLKKDISIIDNALDKISKIAGYFFYWKKGSDDSRQIGVMAQEVEEIFPEVVKTGSDGIKSVDYPKLVAPMIEAIKTLKDQNETLKSDNESMRVVLCDLRPDAAFCAK